jgi:hypothetical protein
MSAKPTLGQATWTALKSFLVVALVVLVGVVAVHYWVVAIVVIAVGAGLVITNKVTEHNKARR